METERQRKNLILIHLESVSNTILWQYRIELETIWRLSLGSLYYEHYNSSATSTAMSINAVFTGNNALNDHNQFFSDQNPYKDTVGNIITNLREDFGYACTRVFYDPFLLEPPGEDVQLCPQARMAYHQMDVFLRDCKRDKKNFFLSFTDYVSHMAYQDEFKIEAKKFTERFRAGYRQINASTNQLLSLVSKHGYADNTVIACYGDHGDELWSHSFKNGRCHTLEPYASLTSAPFFIFDNGEHIGLAGQLVGSEDIRETLLKRLFPGYNPTGEGKAFRTSPFSGIDVNTDTRRYSHSQSLYALQDEYTDRERSVIKSYAVTNGELRLVASYGEHEPENSGLELYYDQFDPTNSRNLLDFFTLDENGDIVEFAPPPAVENSSFSKAFNPEEAAYLSESYATLKAELLAYVRAKEAEALKLNTGGCSLMPDMVFAKARQRIRSDYDA